MDQNSIWFDCRISKSIHWWMAYLQICYKMKK
jgi:hypothetical protein